MPNDAIRTLAIVVNRGTSNNLFQVATLVRAATALEMAVRVLFRGAAACKLARDQIYLDEWSPIYAPILPKIAERLTAADFTDMESFLRDAKEHGDDVQLWASRESLNQAGLAPSDLISCIDGSIAEAEFGRLTALANVSLVF